jgi:hypothetical protein
MVTKKGPDNKFHHWAEMACRGFSKKARKDYIKNLQCDADARAKKHVIKDYWDRYGRDRINPDDDRGIYEEDIAEVPDGSIYSISANINQGLVQLGQGSVARPRVLRNRRSQSLSQQVWDLQAMALSNAGQALPPMPGYGASPFMTNDPRPRPSGRTRPRVSSRETPRQNAEASHIPISETPDTRTARVPTAMVPLGDMQRTFVEGLVPFEESEDEEPARRTRARRMGTRDMKSFPPGAVKSDQ